MRQRKRSKLNLADLVHAEEAPSVGVYVRLEKSYVDKMNAIADREHVTRTDFVRAAIQYFWTRADLGAGE